MRRFKKNKQNKVRFIRDKLFINDIEYIPTEDEINAVKQRRQPEYRNRDSAYANDKRDEQSTSRQSYRYDERQNSGQQWRQDRVIYNRNHINRNTLCHKITERDQTSKNLTFERQQQISTNGEDSVMVTTWT